MWDRWLSYHSRPKVTQVFCQLSNIPEYISGAHLDALEKFILFVYNPNFCESSGINYYRIREFECSTHNNLRLLPPSKIGLLEHVKRACYQGGWIWRHCITNTVLPDPEQWGWRLIDGQYIPLWQTLAEQVDSEVITSCKTVKYQQCSCARKGVNCIPFCKCQRKCLYKVV